MADPSRSETLKQTARIVAAHLGHNRTATDAVPQLIQSVYNALATLGDKPVVDAVQPTPAVPIRKSVFPDHIICLEDGAKMKMLKRYLQVRFGLTPAAYRERWGLPSDYPMVAPSYASRRSALAKGIGLGRKKLAVESSEPEAEAEAELDLEPEVEPDPEPAPVVEPVRAKRSRQPKA